MDQTEQVRKKSMGKLKMLVYVGLAGGMAGIAAGSSAAHGNASPATAASPTLTWDANNFTVEPSQDAVKTAPQAKE